MLNKDDNAQECFVRKMNQAYLNRSNDRIPFRPITQEEWASGISDHAPIFALYNDNEELVGGAQLSCDAQRAKIKHVWIDPQSQGKGYAQVLLKHLEKEAVQRGINLLRLSVAHIYAPAVNLYRKSGYLPISICANESGTYYFIDMEKQLGGKRIPEAKRVIRLLISKLKFSILFREDSTPTWIHRMIFGKKDERD